MNVEQLCEAEADAGLIAGGYGVPDLAPDVSGPLRDVVETFRRWLHMPDPGKTETIAPLAALPYVHPAAVVSPAALLSGTARKEREKDATGGILRSVGEFGIIQVKDLGSLLSLHREARAEALAALREVYDGRYDRPIGTGGGRILSWSGKCGLNRRLHPHGGTVHPVPHRRRRPPPVPTDTAEAESRGAGR